MSGMMVMVVILVSSPNESIVYIKCRVNGGGSDEDDECNKSLLS